MCTVDILQFEKTFLGTILGIGVTVQEETNILLVHILAEDDGCWGVLQGTFSSYWLPDFNRVWSEFQSWLELNTTQERWGRALKKDVRVS